MTNPRRIGFYRRVIGPHLVHVVCNLGAVRTLRERVVPRASGVVLEIGFGSGLNLPFYQAEQIERVIGIEPDATLLRFSRENRRSFARPVEVVQATAEQLPLEADSIDSAVLTFTLCSVGDPVQVIAEIARVLKPNGRVLLCEHGRAKNSFAARWQDRLNGPWKRIALGCNLNRNPRDLLEAAGFVFEEFELLGTQPIPRLLATYYLGTARLGEKSGR